MIRIRYGGLSLADNSSDVPARVGLAMGLAYLHLHRQSLVRLQAEAGTL